MEDRKVFCGWLQLDIKPFKHTLRNVIKKWSWMFKEHLLNHVNERLASCARKRGVTVLCVIYSARKRNLSEFPYPLLCPCSVRELSSFLQDTTLGLSDKVVDGDYAGLVSIMGHLMAIRDRQISNDKHFKPLKSTAELLKTYGQQLPDSIYTQLEVCVGLQAHITQSKLTLLTATFTVSLYLYTLQELPEKWKSLKKIAFTVKHEVAPLQSNEVSVIRRKCVWFEVSSVGCQNPTQGAQCLTSKPLHFLCFIMYEGHPLSTPISLFVG